MIHFKKILLTLVIVLGAGITSCKNEVSVSLTECGKLAAFIPEGNISLLKITGNLNASDIKTLRDSIYKISNLDLSDVTFIQDNTSYYKEGNNAFTISKYTIGESMFYGIKNEFSLILPQDIQTIEKGAFRNCEGLTKITFPQNIVTIKKGAFMGCFKLTTLSIDNNITEIGELAFSNCFRLKSITIGNKIEHIGAYAFGNCHNLKKIQCLNPIPPTIKDNTFNEKGRSVTVYVPKESIEAYRKANGWKEFEKIRGI